MPPKKSSGGKKKGKKNKAGGASSTKILTKEGARVTTVATSNDAVAAPPPEPKSLLERGRTVWAETVASGNDQSSSAAEEAAPAVAAATDVDVPVPDSPLAVNTTRLVVAYSEYRSDFECRDGICRWKDIDDAYAISFVFKGDFKYRIRAYPPGTNSSMEQDAPVVNQASGPPGVDEDGARDASLDETYFELEAEGIAPGSTFELEVVEDEEAGLCVAKRDGPIEFFKDPNEQSFIANGEGGGRKEGCSCLYGNPCADKYVCDNWDKRFDVAKKNGWKGF